MDRVLSDAARCSAPTWSTPGSPCRKRRSDESDPATSRSRIDVRSTSDWVVAIPTSIGWMRTSEPHGGVVTSTDQDGGTVEKFAPNGGTAIAVIGGLVALGFFLIGVFDRDNVPLWVPAIALFSGVLLYMSTVR